MNDFYLGNKNLKRKDVRIGYTQEQIAEYLKCASDVDYFCENYVKIVSIDGGLVPFKPYDYQKRMFKTFDDNRFAICKMPRQVGKTTGVVGYLLHRILFNENYNIAVLANKQVQAREILSRVQLAYEWLPKWMQQGIVEWNKGNIELENGSKILASATSSSAIRGQSYNCISGESIVTIRFEDNEYNISVKKLNSLLANSSKNIKILNTSVEDLFLNEADINVFREQVHKLVLSDHNKTEKRNVGSNNRKTPHYSKMYGGDGFSQQPSDFDDQRTCISSSFVNENDRRQETQKETALCLHQNGGGQTGQSIENELERSKVLHQTTFRKPERPYEGEKTFSRNEEETFFGKDWKGCIRGTKTQTINFYDREKHPENERVETKNISFSNGEKENKRTFRQDQQEPRKNTENSRNPQGNEEIGRVKNKNERSCQGKSSLEQRIEVKTSEGFKRFDGIRKTTNQPVIKLSLTCGTNIVCTRDHKISTEYGWLEAENCVGLIINTETGQSVVDLIEDYGSEDVFDLLEVEDTNSFYANGILVHNCIYLDEFAFVPRNIQDTFFASVFPTISSGKTSKLLITSTPNGMNMFYKIWMDSVNDQNSYARVDVHWSDVPGRDEAWKEETIRNTSVDQFRQEFESCAYETLINTNDGHIPIGKLYDKLYDIEKMADSDQTIVINDKYNINSPEGFVPFLGINKIVKDRFIHLKFSNGKELKCSEDHPISTINGIVKAKNLDKKTEINTRYNVGCFVTSKSIVKNQIDLYDIINCGTQHLYYTNDIISHNCEFLGSTNTLIHPAILSKLVYVRPLEQPHDVKIYKHPIKDHIYAMTVDVSEGLGLDSSTLVVIDCTTVPYEVVATFADANISQLMFPTLLANIGKYYNEASVLVEINIGSQVVNILHQDLEYENIVMTKMSGRKGTIIGSAGNQNRLGIKTTKITKRIGCANLKTLVESNKIILNDFNIINELSTYVVDGTSYNAEDGHHDDLVMCLVLFAWMVSQNYFKDVSNTDIRRRIAEEIEDDFTPFGMIDDGREDEFDGFVSNDQFEKFLLS